MTKPSPRVQAVFDLVDSTDLSLLKAARQLGVGYSFVNRQWHRFRPMEPLRRGCKGGLATRCVQGSGVDPDAPVVGVGRRISAKQRTTIAYLLNEKGCSARTIAQVIGKHPTTVSREIIRNTVDGVYNPIRAQNLADGRMSRPKARKLDTNLRLRAMVVQLMAHRYSDRIPLHSPQHVARRLRELFPEDPSMHVSHETIYQSIYIRGAGSLRQEIKLEKALRSGRSGRKPRSPLAGMTHTRAGKSWVRGAEISLREHDFPDIHTREIPGHWEGDLIIGTDGTSALITLVERTSRYAMIRRIPNHESRTVTTLLNDMVEELSMPGAWKSLTWDQGVEMAKHKKYFHMPQDFKIYFADPHAPWQRGTNESTNKLIREYFPKDTDFNQVTDEDVRKVQIMLNDRVRLALNGKTPYETLPTVLNDALTA